MIEQIAQNGLINTLLTLDLFTKSLLVIIGLLIITNIGTLKKIKELKNIKEFSTNILNYYQYSFIQYIEEIIYKTKSNLSLYVMNLSNLKSFMNMYSDSQRNELYNEIYKSISDTFKGENIYIVKDKYHNILVFQVQNKKDMKKESIKRIEELKNKLYTEGIETKLGKKHLDFTFGCSNDIKVKENEKSFNNLMQEAYAAFENSKTSSTRYTIYADLEEENKN